MNVGMHAGRLVSVVIAALMVVGAALVAAPAAGAQIELSVFRGVVTDEGGKPIEGATVRLVDAEHGRDYTTRSDRKGVFYRRGLPAGSYDIVVEKEGYKRVEGDIRLTAGVDRNYTFELVPAAPEGSADFTAGVAAYNKGDYAAAATAFQSAAAAQPDVPDIHVNLALAYLHLKRTADATRELETAARLAPDSANVQFQLGNAYVEANDLDRAAAAFEKGLAAQTDLQNTDAYDATVILGAVYFAKGDNEKAITQFTKALAAKPDAPAPTLGLAKAYFSQGNVDAAKPLFERIVASNPDSSEAAEAKQFLAELNKLGGS